MELKKELTELNELEHRMLSKGDGKRRAQKGRKLPEEIKEALDELELVRSYFEAAECPELIDYAIYREKSVLARLSYLYKKLRLENSTGK